jgi:hypothetical protein
VLATASNYFFKRLVAWDSDPWTMTGADGKPLLMVGVEEGLHEAAAAVLRLMYEEVVPDGTPALQLAKVCSGVGSCPCHKHLLKQAVNLGMRSSDQQCSVFNTTMLAVSHAV